MAGNNSSGPVLKADLHFGYRGESNYQMAVRLGLFEGTEAEFIEAQKGASATPEQIAEAVDQKWQESPPQDGQNATPEQVATAVAAWMAANPAPSPVPAVITGGNKVGDLMTVSRPEGWTYVTGTWDRAGVVVAGETGLSLRREDVAAGLVYGFQPTNVPFRAVSSVTQEADLTPEAVALFARMSAPPSAERQKLYNQFIVNMIRDGFWSRLDVLMIAGTDVHNSTRNWIADRYHATPVGTVDFVADRGFLGNGTNFWLDSGFDPIAAMAGGSKFQRDSLSFGGGIQDTNGTTQKGRTVGGMYAGTTNAAVDVLHDSGGTNLTSFKIGSAANMVTTVSMAPHHFLNSRTSATEVALYVDGVLQWRDLNNASMPWFTDGLGTTMKWMGRASYASGAWSTTRLSTARHSYFLIGGAFTEAEAKKMNYHINALLAGIGAETLLERTFTPAMALASNTFTTTMTPSGSNRGGSFRVRQLGTLADSAFTTTLVQALQAAVTTGVTFDGVDKLTFTESLAGPITIARTTSAAAATGATHALQFFDASEQINIPQATVAKVVGTPALPVMPAMSKGLNLSGMEFSGTVFVPTLATVDDLIAQGYNIIRLPCLWQRMQPTMFGPLSTGGVAAQYKTVVDYIVSKGAICVIDSAHNYGARPEGAVGSAAVPVTAFDDYCIKLYQYLGGGAKLIYDLMNEPSGANWGKYASSHIAAMRAAGCLNRIHVYYTTWSMADTYDPLSNMVLDVHKYLDPDMSGQSGVCTVGAGSSRLTAYTTAARAAGKKLFLGEFAAGYPTVAGQEQCAIELPALIDAVQNNADVWTGWAAWGAGRFWNATYPYRLEYADGSTADTPYNALLKSKL